MANEIGLIFQNKIAIRRKVFLAIQSLDTFCVEGATQEKFKKKDCLFAFNVAKPQNNIPPRGMQAKHF